MGVLNEFGAYELAQKIRDREITSEALVQDCLDRVDAREPEVHAWQFLDREAALYQARVCDSSPVKGALHGVPVGIKDLIDTCDMPTCYGSSIYTDHRPALDAECVSLLREAGAVIMGKTVTTEFAAFNPPKTRNPHNLSRTPGGSSSGSAAAVADRMVPLAIGTQTAGSVIRPAAFCGVVGFKPTFHYFPTTGIKPISSELDTLLVIVSSGGIRRYRMLIRDPFQLDCLGGLTGGKLMSPQRRHLRAFGASSGWKTRTLFRKPQYRTLRS